MKKPYRLWKRGSIYYYQLPESTGWKSTGKTAKSRAETFVVNLIKSGDNSPDITLGEYAQSFFKWDIGNAPRCPHCQRVLASGGQIGPEHAERQRRLLERFIIGDKENKPDLIARKRLGDIKRRDCIDFRSRVIKNLGVDITDREAPKGKRVTNLVMTVLSTIFSEAIEREDLDANPAARLSIKYQKAKRGVFSAAELRDLFPPAVDDNGPWPDLRTKAAFLTAGACGLRRNEIRALRWGSVNLEEGKLSVVEAFKGNRRDGLPKWDKTRGTALPTLVAQHMKALKSDKNPSGYVFGNPDGTPLGTEIWKTAWSDAMEALEIDASGRNLVPHSLRHSIATELRARGVSDILLKKGFGWTSNAVLEGYTDHFDAEQFAGQAKLVDELFGKSV